MPRVINSRTNAFGGYKRRQSDAARCRGVQRAPLPQILYSERGTKSQQFSTFSKEDTEFQESSKEFLSKLSAFVLEETQE